MSSPKPELEFVSTVDPTCRGSLRDVLLSAMPAKGGLWVPTHIPQVAPDFVERHRDASYADLAEAVIAPYFADVLGAAELRRLCREAYDFPVPLVRPEGFRGAAAGRIGVLELFHGPSSAFKDFAVRTLVRVTAGVLGDEFPQLTVLAATSGDTGAAVTEACAGVPGVRAVVLYPRVGVSGVQESQIARPRPGVVALSVDGTFDDCQAMVKRALADDSLRRRRPLLTANSINPVRLIAQVPFAFHAKRLLASGGRMGVVVPSGNLGNVGAVQLARRMGLDVAALVAATNVNSPLPDLFATGEYRPRRAVPTASNAMDIGDPNNLARLLAWREGGPAVEAVTVDDDATLDAMRRVRAAGGYVLCPHSAVGWTAAEDLLARDGAKLDDVIVFGTAHPAKFPDVLRQAFGDANASRFPGDLPAPAPLRIGNDFEAVRKVLDSEAGFGR
ncbi:MAG: threonine synthase [Verrucomicrobiota bacterium]